MHLGVGEGLDTERVIALCELVASAGQKGAADRQTRRRKTHGDGGEDDPRSREEVLVVEALPHRVTSALVVRI